MNPLNVRSGQIVGTSLLRYVVTDVSETGVATGRLVAAWRGAWVEIDSPLVEELFRSGEWEIVT